MPLTPGSDLASYRILAPLGAGAMGEVYRARDTRLEREVAIKVLPEAFAEDEERLRRFEREAKTLATLNHPNVAQIFGVDRAGHVHFLVLELVPGETLEDRLLRGPLPVDEAIEIAREIASGLEAAHEAGVIHRDLKPANVRLTPDGHVKVLDFGLAKPMRVGEDPRSTDSVLTTESGRLLGTPTYMAPEQARGRTIDRRVDVWAFGCVLYECLTAARAFDGESLTDVLSAVISKEPDFARLPAATPPRVRDLLRRCLEKDPRERLRDIGDARLELERAAGGEDAAPLGERAGRARLLPWLVAAALGMALVVVVALGRGPAAGTTAGSAKPAFVSVRLPSALRLFREDTPEQCGLLALSPDGTRLVFLGQEGADTRLYVRSLHSPRIDALPGTEAAIDPFFSPDGEWVAFSSRGKLRKVAIAGGSPIEICDIGTPRGGAWGEDGTIVFSGSTTSPLLRVSSAGGTPVRLTELDPARSERTHRWPVFLPGGDEVAFTVGVKDKPGSYDDAAIDAVSLATGKRRTLVRGASFARVSWPDRLVFGRNGQLFVLPLDRADGSFLASSAPVLEGVAGIPGSGVLHFDVARNGTLAYSELDPRESQFELAWLARDGTMEPLPHAPREYRAPRLSPDGTRVAVAIGPGGGQASDVWILDAKSNAMTRLTFDGICATPSWTADGKRVVYGMATPPGYSFGWKLADGGDDGETLLRFEDDSPRFPVRLSPDGTFIPFVTSGTPGQAQDVHFWTRSDGRFHPLAATPANEQYAALSPNGKWLAYVSDDSGTREVYVQSIPERRGRWQVSTDGGGFPVFSRDGKELFFIAGRKIFSVAVSREEPFTHGPPTLVTEADTVPGSESIVGYDVAEDGRFLVVRKTSREAFDRHVNVVLGWGSSARDAAAGTR